MEFKPDFYKKIFHSLDINAVLMRVESDGRYYPIWCSQEFTRMIEGTAEEFIQLESGGTMNSIHPDDHEEVAYLFRNHITKSGTNSINLRKRTIKGNWIWVNVHYSFVEDDGIWYAYCNYFDITAIKKSELRAENMYEAVRAELENLASESLISLRLNLTKDLVEDCRGRELYGVDVGGFKISENVGDRMKCFPLERDKKKFVDKFSTEHLLESYHKGENTVSDIFFTRRPNGRKCFVHYNVTLSENPSNGDIMAFASERDYNIPMVRKIILNKALVEQYDMITYIADDTYGVVIGDAAKIGKGSIFPKKNNGIYSEYLNTQVLPVLSGTEEERQENLEKLSLESIEKNLAEKEPYEVNIACEIDGETFYKRFIYYLVDKEAKFYILLKSDTTHIRREQLLRNVQLKSALDTANQANVAKTAFLSSMSHEIRTPMNAIIGLSRIAIQEPGLSDRTRDQLQKIDISARHLLSIINDILDMSRIESGRMILHNERFSFSEMLGQINTMISGQCDEKGIHYDCNIVNHVDSSYIGDAGKLKQILINILGNAVKFTDRGGTITFTIERVVVYDDKATLRFEIKDTGIGMEESYLPKIFDLFTQEDSTNKNAYGGTGLGMPITKNIVELMNGNISVESKKHVGTTFTVTITLGETDEESDIKSAALHLGDLSVLIIDDDPIACEHARLVLEEVGISADVAMTCKDALEMVKLRHARQESYNLLLIDLKMPDCDGIEVTKKVREVTGLETTIIILTAHQWDDIIDEAMAAGVDRFMTKPLFATNVMEEFSQAIEQKKIDFAKNRKLADLTDKRVLLVEDMFINAEIMKEILGMREMIVEHAENGQIAVDMFNESAQNYYNVVLMDIRMPIMDGLQATETIRALDRPDAKTVPIIAMTANAFDEDVQRSLQAGMNAHLSKPVDPERLYKTLEEMIPVS